MIVYPWVVFQITSHCMTDYPSDPPIPTHKSRKPKLSHATITHKSRSIINCRNMTHGVRLADSNAITSQLLRILWSFLLLLAGTIQLRAIMPNCLPTYFVSGLLCHPFNARIKDSKGNTTSQELCCGTIYLRILVNVLDNLRFYPISNSITTFHHGSSPTGPE